MARAPRLGFRKSSPSFGSGVVLAPLTLVSPPLAVTAVVIAASAWVEPCPSLRLSFLPPRLLKKDVRRFSLAGSIVGTVEVTSVASGAATAASSAFGIDVRSTVGSTSGLAS